jgi:flagellar hook protein FlgE
MLGAIYISQSGMSAYSKGLDVISNNVANLNTPGFKIQTPVFSDQLFQNGDGAMPSADSASGGAGVQVDANNLSFTAGNMQDTGDPLTAALDGSGFFVLQQPDGQYQYTRAGQFELNNDGVLVETRSKLPVLVRTDTADRTTFNIDSFRTYPPKATTTVNLSGTLSRTGSATFNLTGIKVVDSTGAAQTLSANMVRSDSDASSWSVEVDDAQGKSIGTGAVAFNDDGTPKSDSSSMTFTLSPGNGAASTVTLDFGAAGSYAGVTSISSNTVSQTSVTRQDGLQLGTLSSTAYSDNGQLTLTYSNGATKTPASLLLAQFDGENGLKEIDGGMFTAPADMQPVISTAQTMGLGRVVGGKVEQSNVDLTSQFSNLIIVQRGYQASSQVTSVANEMLQQLLTMDQHP